MLVHIFIFVFPFVIMQHIEDLTQEKFSLQRALEASRVLAESLATENSSLTENYNNQVGLRAIVCHFVEYSTETFSVFNRYHIFMSFAYFHGQPLAIGIGDFLCYHSRIYVLLDIISMRLCKHILIFHVGGNPVL
jgi:hypothetical protein